MPFTPMTDAYPSTYTTKYNLNHMKDETHLKCCLKTHFEPHSKHTSSNYKNQLTIAVIVTIMLRGKTCLFQKVRVGNGKVHPITGHEGPEVV